MKQLPGYMLILSAILLLLSAVMLIFSLALIIEYKTQQYNLGYMIRLGAFILFQLLTSFLLFRYGRKLIRRAR